MLKKQALANLQSHCAVIATSSPTPYCNKITKLFQNLTAGSVADFYIVKIPSYAK